MYIRPFIGAPELHLQLVGAHYNFNLHPTACDAPPFSWASGPLEKCSSETPVGACYAMFHRSSSTGKGAVGQLPQQTKSPWISCGHQGVNELVKYTHEAMESIDFIIILELQQFPTSS